MGPIQVVVTDANNLVLEVTPTPSTTVILDRGIAGPVGPAGPGDVNGPASATDNAVARFDGTTGKLIQNSVVLVSDTGAVSGVTDLTASGAVTLSGGTANGVAYLNGSKVLTTGSALTFDGSNFTIANAGGPRLYFNGDSTSSTYNIFFNTTSNLPRGYVGYEFATDQMPFAVSGNEQMRLTSSLLSVTPGATIQGLTVGRGAGAVATNTAVGASALAANTTGAQNTAVGREALLSNLGGTANSAFGEDALVFNDSGSYNTAHGARALFSNTTASNNTAVGYQAGYTNVTGTNQTFIGNQAGYQTTGNYNTAIGNSAGYNTTSGTWNTFLGVNAGPNSGTASTGSYNVAVGGTALQNMNGAAANNTAVGYQSLYTNTTASNNTAVGYQAGYKNTSGTRNTFLGVFTGFEVSTGQSNTYVGYTSGPNGIASTGSYNTAVGDSSLYSNNSGTNNTAVGYQAGYTNSTGQNLVAIGYQAGYTSNANNSTYVGYFAGQETTGTLNTFVGVNGVGYKVTTGTKNVIIGGYSGLAAPISQTGSNNIVLSDGDGNPRAYANSLGNWTFPGTNGSIYITGSGYTTNPSAMVLGQYTSTRAYIQTPAGGAVEIWDDATNPIAIFQDDRNVTFSGNISVGSAAPTTSGTGITFPATQSASSNANTLDDYEEGTFNPVVKGYTTAGTATYSRQQGYYTKIGNRVFINIDLVWTSGTGTGDLYVDGLVFPTSSSGMIKNYAALTDGIALTAGNYIAGGGSGVSSTQVYIYQSATGTSTQLAVPYAAAGQIIISGQYFVD
jgi:hypothetical protein